LLELGNTIIREHKTVLTFVPTTIKIAQQGIQNWASQTLKTQKAQALQTWQPHCPIQTAQSGLALNLPQHLLLKVMNAPQQFNQYVRMFQIKAKYHK